MDELSADVCVGYCGNSLASSSDEAPLDDCDMLCGGDASQYCGSGERLELYSTTAIQTPTSSSIPEPTPDPVHRGEVGDYTLVGCWTEGDGARALGQGATAAADMTNEMCAEYCSEFRYFGTEYGAECYCGRFTHSTSVTAPLEECNMVCGGNSSEYCGAANRLELYMNTDIVGGAPEQPAAAGEFVFLGCRTEVVNGTRALPDDTTSSDEMTNEACAEYCEEYELFGTQYGRECYCGEVLSELSREADASDCGMLCSGADSEYCGGSDRLSVYTKREPIDEPGEGDEDEEED